MRLCGWAGLFRLAKCLGEKRVELVPNPTILEKSRAATTLIRGTFDQRQHTITYSANIQGESSKA